MRAESTNLPVYPNPKGEFNLMLYIQDRCTTSPPINILTRVLSWPYAQCLARVRSSSAAIPILQLRSLEHKGLDSGIQSLVVKTVLSKAHSNLVPRRTLFD